MPAWISSGGAFALRACTLLEQSSTQARLAVDDPSTLPRRFDLLLSRSTRRGYRCEITSRKGKIVDVAFIDDTAARH